MQGTALTSKDGEGRTALHHAVMRSHLPAVDVILELGGPKLLLAKDILGCTPVHLAAVQNQVTLQCCVWSKHQALRPSLKSSVMQALHYLWDVMIVPNNVDSPVF